MLLRALRFHFTAVWPFDWLCGMKGALHPALVSSEKFPKVFAWKTRFNEAVSAAKAKGSKPKTFKGVDAVEFVTQAEFAEPEGLVDSNDPLGLEKGQDVESWPVDTGFKHHDRGILVSLTSKEVVLASKSKIEGKEVRIHHPRWNFRTRAANGEGAKL